MGVGLGRGVKEDLKQINNEDVNMSSVLVVYKNARDFRFITAYTNLAGTFRIQT